MAEPTKQELAERLKASIDLNAQLERRVKSIDPEAMAIADCIKAVAGLKSKEYGYSSTDNPDRAAIRRVLNAAAARFGVAPDYEMVARLVERQNSDLKLAEAERQELDRLRRLESTIDAARHDSQWDVR